MDNLLSLGKTSLRISKLGVGTWSWGDKSIWGYGKGYSDADLYGAFITSIASGISFFDTAELYGYGKSEELLGEFIRKSGVSVSVATKFFPYPWRLSRQAVLAALRRSLKRLNLGSVDLYQIHWPFHFLSIPSMMSVLSEAVAEGIAKAVGVSNYSADQMRRAVDALAKNKIPLASNQVEYSLLHLSPEQDGILDACKDAGVTLIAYSPLAMGMLTGKYSGQKLPQGFRRLRYRSLGFREFDTLVDLLARAGESHGGKTCAQVALNWLMRKGVVPIPGAKNANQAAQNAGSSGWSLTDEEMEALHAAASRVNR
jgi:aryl-alcohol dehydrogenase-like predicted oxidoreductase